MQVQPHRSTHSLLLACIPTAVRHLVSASQICLDLDQVQPAVQAISAAAQLSATQHPKYRTPTRLVAYRLPRAAQTGLSLQAGPRLLTRFFPSLLFPSPCQSCSFQAHPSGSRCYLRTVCLKTLSAEAVAMGRQWGGQSCHRSSSLRVTCQ